MCLKKCLFILFLLIVSRESYAQYSVHTINVDREFYDWRDSGVNCNENTTTYWYVLREEMNTEIRQQVRYCGGSVLYVGQRNAHHLYNQTINVTCDSVTALLKLDNNFLNILPLIAEEKVSENIYKDAGLYYLDSANLIFKASVVFIRNVTEEINDFLKSIVDSVEGFGSNTFVYGTRNEMLLIAGNNLVETVSDIGKEGPLYSKPSPLSFRQIGRSNIK